MNLINKTLFSDIKQCLDAGFTWDSIQQKYHVGRTTISHIAKTPRFEDFVPEKNRVIPEWKLLEAIGIVENLREQYSHYQNKSINRSAIALKRVIELLL